MPILKLKASRFDELNTPESAVYPLLRHLPKWVKTVWCPCDTEESNVVKVIRNAGYNVIATHIMDGMDFFTINEPENYDMIITNPPYSNKNEFIGRCVELGKPWALLLPLDALCGTQRMKLYDMKDAGVITLANRIDFTGKGANWFYNAWVCSWPEINSKWIREV